MMRSSSCLRRGCWSPQIGTVSRALAIFVGSMFSPTTVMSNYHINTGLAATSSRRCNHSCTAPIFVIT
jgi:hypothetical protein